MNPDDILSGPKPSRQERLLNRQAHDGIRLLARMIARDLVKKQTPKDIVYKHQYPGDEFQNIGER